MSRYYVYALIDPRDGNPYYIGKGSGNRVQRHFTDTELCRLSPKNSKIKKLRKLGFKPRNHTRVLKDDLNESEAFELEAFIANDIIGIDNLTNVALCGDQIITSKYTKLAKEDISSIRWLAEYSNLSAPRAFNQFKDEFQKQPTVGIFQGIWYFERHIDVEPRKPDFFDAGKISHLTIPEKLSVEQKYGIFCEYFLTDKTAEEVAEGCGIQNPDTITSWNRKNTHGLRERFIKEHGEKFISEKLQRYTDRDFAYQVLEEWLTSWDSASQVAARYDIPKTTVVNWKNRDYSGVFTRFKEKHGEDFLKRKKEQMLEERYQAYCKWRLKGYTAEEAVAPIKKHTSKHNLEGIRSSDAFGLRTRFKNEHPEQSKQ